VAGIRYKLGRQYTLRACNRAGGVTKSRNQQPEYLHPVNGIGINWSHPWSRDGNIPGSKRVGQTQFTGTVTH
jgi:hypothetical protein